MGGLKRALVALLLACPAPASAGPIDRWAGQIAEASKRFGVPEEWIRRVMRAESGGRTSLGGRPIVSRAGAMGLMQVMPGTWRELRAAHGLGADPHNPRDNILAGAAYLRDMYNRFGYPGLFAAYNAGPERYSKHLSRGTRLPSETIAYVASVAGVPVAPASAAEVPIAPAYADPRAAPAPAASIFAVLAAAPPGAEQDSERPRGSGESLFVRLTATEER